jgi:hypothetical protein
VQHGCAVVKNAALVLSYGSGVVQQGLERQLSKAIVENSNLKLEDVATWYEDVNSMEIKSMKLGDTPPEILSMSFENADVFGEFRLNLDTRLVASNDETEVGIKVKVLGISQVFPVVVSRLLVHSEFQIMGRFGKLHI